VFLAPTKIRPARMRPSQIAWRLFWMGMLALHAGAFRSAGLELTSFAPTERRLAIAARLIVLGVTALFFCLKLIDVGWLRLLPGWRSKVYSLVAIGIIHLGVVERVTQPEFAYSKGHLGVVLFAGGALSVKPLWRLLPCPSTLRADPPLVPSLRFLHRLAPGLSATPRNVTLRACVGPRAPPILS